MDSYRITSPTLSMFFEGGCYMARTLPKGAIVTIRSESFDGDKLVEVGYEGSSVMMFTQDLRSRGEKIPPHE